MLILFVFIFISLVANGFCYQQCFAKPLQKNPEADARFSVIISLRQTTGADECKEILPSGIMILSAIDWVVSRLNNVTLVPGVKFGYDVYDDCGVERYSMYSALDAMDYYFPDQLTTCAGNSSQYYLGILGPSRSSTSEKVLSVVKNTDIPVISPFATFPDLHNSQNFLRTIPSDDDQVMVFIDLIVKHKWNYVVAMYTTDNYGTNGVTKIVTLAKQRNICVNVIPGFSVTETFHDPTFRDSIFDKLLKHIENTTDRTLGVLYFGQRGVIQQLLNKMQLTADIKTNLRNIKWILSESIGTRVSVLSNAGDVTNEAMTVSMAHLSIPEIHQHYQDIQSSTSTSDDIGSLIKSYGPFTTDDWNDYMVSLLDSVFAVTMSLKTAFDTKCKGYKVICLGFDTYYNTHKLETIYSTKINYTALGPNIAPMEFVNRQRFVEFNETGDLIPDQHTPLYHVNMYKDSSLTQVGEFVNGGLVVNSKFPNTFSTSICQKGCEQCVDVPDISYEFIEGDVYVVGFFSLHRLSDDPFGCGVFRNSTFDVLSVEAFLNSIKEAQAETGIKFGGIAFDDCYSPSRATMIISDIFTGKLKVPSDSSPVDPSKIVGVVGPFPSGVTVPVTFLFSSIAVPSISYASTSPDLDDKDINFPYFFRTVPSDVDQAHAMLEILKTMEWYSIGLVYVNNNYGSKGKNAFKNLANAYGICIVAEIEVTQENSPVGNQDAYQGLEYVRTSGTNLFVYFGTEGRIVDVLAYVKKLSNAVTPYVFIGSDDWADSRNIRNTFGEMVKGSLSFKIKTRTLQTNFIENIVHKTSSLDTAGYWYKQFFRNYFQCYFQNDFVKTFPNPCSKNITISDTSGIMADGRVSHCILAVKALTKGIAQAKQKLCNNDIEFPCLTYKRRTDIVRDDISNVTLLDDNQISFRVFDKNGNGDIGFQILQITQESDDFVYAEVGSYDNNNLVIKSDNVNTALNGILSVSTCAARNPDATTNTPLASTEQEEFRIADIVIIALLGSLCVVLTIVIFAIAFCFWRRITGLHKMLDETRSKITTYNDIGSARRHKQKQTTRRNGDIGFDNPIFPNGEITNIEPPGQHYLPLHDSNPSHSNHRYEGDNGGILNQTTPKQISSSNQSFPVAARPDLPPRNVPDKKEVSKSESDIHNSFPIIKPKMGNYIGSSNQPRMGTALQTTPTDSLHSQGSVFNFRNYLAPSPDEAIQQDNIPHDQRNILPSTIHQPSSPGSPSDNVRQPQSPSKRTPHSSPLSHNSSIHSQFSGETLHMTGNVSPQRRKRLKSFSSEEPQKISRV